MKGLSSLISFFINNVTANLASLMNARIASITFILLLAAININAQYSITYTDMMGDPIKASDVHVCTKGDSLNSVRIIIVDATADDALVTIMMPPGMEYQPGSVMLDAQMGGLSIAEGSIADLSNPEFVISPVDLSAGNYIQFSWGRVADCEAMEHQMSGGTFKEEITIESQATSAIVTDTDPGLNTYDVLVPSLSLAGEGPISGNLGDNICRDLTITNGGMGYLSEFSFFIVDGMGTQTTSLTTPGGISLTPSSINIDTLFYTIGASVISEFNTGNELALFENGEQVFLERCYTITSCDNDSYYGITWGCNDIFCVEPSILMQQTNINNLVPNVSLGFAAGTFDNGYCFDGSDDSNSSGVMQTFEMCNTGGGAATELSFRMYNSTPGSGTGQNYFTDAVGQIRDGAGNLLGTTSTVLPGGSRVGMGCASVTGASYVDHTLDGIILPAGECVTIEIPTFANNLDESCGSCGGSIAWLYFNENHNYKDQCGINSYGTTRRQLYYGGRLISRYAIEMPTDMRDCDEFTIDVNYNLWYGDIRNNINGAGSGGPGSIFMKMDLAGTGLTYTGDGTESFRGTNNIEVTQVGDILCFNMEDISAGSGSLSIPLKASCAAGGGTKSVSMWHEATYDDDNCSGLRHYGCSSKSFQMHCPDPCPEGGATPRFFTLERISLGQADTDNNGVPDGTGLADPSDVRLHRASNCDTIQGTWEIYVNPNVEPTDPNNGNPFNHVYVEFDLFTRNGNCNTNMYTRLFEPLPDAEITIFPAGGGAPINCTVTATIETGDIAKYDLTGCAGKTTWEGGDSIVVKAKYRVNGDLERSGFTAYVANNEVYSSYVPNPVGVNPSVENKYTCDSYNDYMDILHHYHSPWTPNPQSISGCTGTLTYSQRYYINTQTGDIWYPNEYRPFTYLDEWVVQIPEAYQYRPGSIRFSGQVVSDADIVQSGDFITITNLGQFFDVNGGPIQVSDESWSYSLTLQVDPTCDAMPGTFNTRHTAAVVGMGCFAPNDTHPIASCTTVPYYSGNASVLYDAPQPFITGGGEVQYTSGRVCWDVILNNGSNNVDAPFSWFRLTSIDGVLDNYSVSLDGVDIPVNVNGYFELGDNDATASTIYEVCADASACDRGGIEVEAGFGCSGYPEAGVDVPCAELDTLYALPLQSEVQLAVNKEPTVRMDLCTEQDVELIITSAQSAFLDNPLLDIILPAGAFIAGDIEVEYPSGSGDWQLASTTMMGTTFRVNLEGHTAIGSDGITGTVDALTPQDREAVVRFKLITDCDFISGAGLVFQAFGNRPCGDAAINNGVRARTSDLLVDGAQEPYASDVKVVMEGDPKLQGCSGSLVEVDLMFVPLLANMTSAEDTVKVTLDEGIEFVAGSFMCCSPGMCVSDPVESTNVNDQTVLEFMVPVLDITMGATMSTCFTYEITNSSDLECDAVKGMMVEAIANVSGVSCPTEPSGLCPSLKVITGQSVIDFSTEKIELSVLNSDFVCTTTGSVEYNINVKIDSLALSAGQFLNIDLACGDGTFVESVTVDGPLAAGSTSLVSGSIDMSSCDAAGGLIATIGTPGATGNGECICTPAIVNSGPLACPMLSIEKSFISATLTGDGCYDVLYNISVANTGGAAGEYDLYDLPTYDEDIVIQNASYTSDVLGNMSGSLTGVGPWLLGDDVSIAMNSVDTYMLTVGVCMDLEDPNSVGNEEYESCEDGTPGDPTLGEGLYNKAYLDVNEDAMPDMEAEACGDLPYLVHVKTIGTPVQTSAATWDIPYTIIVQNLGGAAGSYTLTDTPMFDTDIIINSAEYSSNATGNTGPTILAGSGPWTLSSMQAIVAGGVHTYALVVSVEMDLNSGTSPGDEAYTACGAGGADPGTAGEGLYNLSSLDENNDGTPEETDDACADLPHIYHTKTLVGTPVSLGGNEYQATFQIEVCNDGGADGIYSLKDEPLFDNDIRITNALFSSTIPSSGLLLPFTPPSGGWTLANNQALTAGDCHIFTIVLDVEMSLNDGLGDNMYNACGSGGTTPGQAGEGLFNQSTIDVNNDGTVDEIDDACGDLPIPSLMCTAEVSQHVLCNGFATGSATAEGIDGQPPYSYAWSGGAGSNATATGLLAGTYQVTITDNASSTVVCDIEITQPMALVCNISGVEDVSCNGADDGTATVSVVGGVSPYSYAWSNAETGTQASSLDGGTHTVTVTDANMCTVVCSVDIVEPAVLSCSTSGTDLTCFEDASGSITVTPLGGTMPFEYSLNGGAWQPGGSYVGIDAGNYTVSIRDASDCYSTCTVTLIEPSELTCSTMATGSAACGQANGSATVTGAGGDGSYTYLWDNGSTSASTSDLTSGLHNVTITDGAGCSNVCSVTIETTTGLSCEITDLINVDCNGAESGEATVMGIGGTSPFTYLWSDLSTDATLGNVAAGTYTVVVEDAVGCTSTCSVEITEPTVLSCTVVMNESVSCNGDSDGQATVTATGGTEFGNATFDYTYLWDNTETTKTAVGLTAGNHSVVVTDENGCTTSCSVTITEPSVLSCSTTKTDVSCNQGNDGTITVTVSGGTADFEYNVNGGPWQSGAVFNMQSAGDHTINVRDINGCTSSCDVSILEPMPLECTTTWINDATCGNDNGAASVSGSGGTAPYTYLWDNGSTTVSVNNLSGGMHVVTITDVNDCESTCDVQINVPGGLSCEVNGTNVLCNGGNDGTAEVVVTGTTSPYSYEWSNLETTQSISSLNAGVYVVTVTDVFGCETVCQIEITEPSALVCTTGVEQNVSCNGGADGSAQVSGTGGTAITNGSAPYTVLWDNGETTFTAINLDAGNHTVTITDANSCTTTCQVNITEPNVVACSTSSTNLICNDDDSGTITVTPSGGTGVYEYSLNGGPYQIGNYFEGLSAGNYIVQVKDENECISTCTADLTEPVLLSCTASEDSPATCGDDNGVATAVAAGGTTGYTYLWDNGETTATATALSPGTHTVTIKDVNNCETECTVVVTTPNGLSCVINDVTNITCFGDDDGTATVAALGGSSPYTYLWSTGETTATAVALVPGENTVVVTDDDGCETSCLIEITEPELLTCSVVNEGNVSCNGLSDGSATVTAVGGTENSNSTDLYSYEWDNGETTKTVVGLSAGTHTVVVTDDNACTTSCTVVITEPVVLSCTLTKTDLICNGDSSGTITVAGADGTLPYEYSLDGGSYQPGALFTEVAAGTHIVSTRDANGCLTSCTIDLIEPIVLSCTASEDSPATCGDDNGVATAVAAGGTAGYTYLWDNGETTVTATALSPGTHTVTIKDVNNCETTCTVVVTTPNGLSCAINDVTNITCFGDDDGTATVAALGGSSPYTYLWSNGETTATAVALVPGENTVVVTDDDGCETSCLIEITEPELLTCSVVNEGNVSCNGLSNGSATVTAVGGTENSNSTDLYSYEWDNGETTKTAVGLSAGTHTVVVTDDNACTTSCTVVITEPVVLSCTLTKTDLICNGDSSGTITVAGADGTLPYEYSLDGGSYQPGALFTEVAAGTHIVSTRDANGCLTSCTIDLTEPIVLSCTASEDSPATCGDDNGVATVVAAGGTAGYTYLWDNGESTATATALSPGTHTVTIKDVNNCETECTVVVTTPNGLSCAINDVANITCFGDDDGTATVAALGGSSPYTYLWSTGETTATAVALVPGENTVVVTDDDGCETSCLIEITEPELLTCSVVNEGNVSCNGLSDGSATVTAVGGTENSNSTDLYSYEWDNGETTKTAVGLSAGTHTVVVTDDNACTTSCTVLITEPVVLSCTLTKTDLVCNGDNSGTITAAGAGGTLPYEYSLDGGSYQPGAFFADVQAGAHIVSTRDANGCLTTCTISLAEPMVLTCTAVEDHEAVCGIDNGSATVSVNGGTGAYAYLWDNGETTSTAIALSGGDHNVTVTDENDCETVCMVNIGLPNELTCIISNDGNVSCNGGDDGAASVIGQDGVPGYTYLWSTGATSAAVTGLTAGVYNVTVSDSDGCESVCLVEITEPELLTCSVINEGNVSCNGLSDGSATINAVGGTPNDNASNIYSYEWDNGETTKTAVGLSAGTHTVVVTDDNACTTSCTVVITEPVVLSCTLTKTDLVCNGDNSGTIAAAGAGGTLPYEYSLDGGSYQPGALFINVQAGSHTVSTRDANGCLTTCMITLTEPILLTCTTVEDHEAVCGIDNGAATVTAMGGTTPYTYLWDNGETTVSAIALSGGDHNVTVTDANDCVTVCTVNIGLPNELTCLIANDGNVTCNGGDDGAASVIGQEGVPAYSYLWSTGATTSNVAGLTAGTYYVTVSDSDGCESVCLVEITEPELLTCSASSVSSVSCNGLSDGSATVNAVGGTSNSNSTNIYSYLWDNGETTQTAISLSAGTHTVVVTDDNDCTTSCAVNISEPAILTCSIDAINVDCSTSTEGLILASGSGGTQPYEYSLNGSAFQIGNSFGSLTAGDYTVTTKDSNGCTTECSVTITRENCYFDLALVKTFGSSSTTPIVPGSTVTFNLEVFNQGTLDAYDVQINDYIPTGLTLADTDWSASGGVATLNNEIALIEFGESEIVTITFTVDTDFMGTSIINDSEIASAEDEDGNNPDDVDSIPGDDADPNDPNDDDTAATDGSDDQDPEEIIIEQTFDLALTKTFKSFGDTNNDGMISVGELVTFTMTVYNQGSIDATSVSITDYVPADLIFAPANNPLWTGGTSAAPSTTIASLLAGASTTVDIVLQVDPSFMGTSIINDAEITAATNLLGQDDTDSTPGDDATPDDLGNNDDVDDQNGGDDQDPEMIMIGQVFDLALTKKYDRYIDNNGDNVLSPGDDVIYVHTVYNQGTVDAYNIRLADYVPVGLELNDATWNNMINPLVAQTNSNISFLAAGDNVDVEIRFTIDIDYRGGNIVNWGEISSADDNDNPMDGFPTDVDSNPDSFNGNDNYGGDDEIGNTNQDEDDHDPAIITPIIEFDLALAKKDQSDLPVSQYGETRIFDIEVTNQGTVIATHFEVIDYIPCGFEFPVTVGTNPGWVYNAASRTATFLYDETIMTHGDVVTLSIELEVVECTGDLSVNYTNYAEIIDYDDDFNDFNPNLSDIDSDPDATNFDDAGGQPWTDSDDYIDGDGSGQSGLNNPGIDLTDEDDHDPERVELFDLALAKTLNTAGPYNYGMDLEFEINVCNQGNIGAQNVVVADYLPAGYTFDFADQSGPWSGSATQPVYTIPAIGVGSCESFTMVLTMISTNGGEKDWVNYAEIISAQNELGQDRTDNDIDSNPGSDNATENTVEPNHTGDDDLTSQDKGGEEDDHDPAGIEVFDLAQVKTVSTSGPFFYGVNVEFTFTLYNQGSIAASNIELIDYIPCGYEFLEINEADGWAYDETTGNARITIPTTLPPGTSITASIVLRLQQCLDSSQEAFTNSSEIAGAISNDPDEDPDDIDSDDDDVNDDTDIIDDESEDPNDEDDHDPATVEIFDLALAKTVANDGPYVPGDKATFFIEVFNQANVTASEFTITDYLNTGFVFNQSDNAGWVQNGNLLTYDVDADLIAEASTTVQLVLEIVVPSGANPGVWVNEAEISYAADLNGNNTADGSLVDSDSTPNNNPDDDNDVTPGDDNDDVIDENVNDPLGLGEDDEDDNDVAGVIVGYDLALNKTTAVSGPYTYGQAVPFDLTIFNQGGLAASNIEITEFIPCGYVFDAGLNPGWTYDNVSKTATYVYTGVILPGSNDVVTIVLRLNQCGESNAFLNAAEISDFDDENGDEPVIDDYDSTPDSNPNNDGNPTDNEVDGNPSDPSNPDEDDHDIENLEIFDLAMTKRIDDVGPYQPGDIARYYIDVYNQGNVDAYNVEITDYLNVGYSFNASANVGWTKTGSLVQTTIAGPISPGNSVRLYLNLEVIVPAGADLNSWYNEAEISGADNDTDPNNMDPIDADSTPDTDPNNDNDLVDGIDDNPIFGEGDDNDNEINENPSDPFGNGDDDEDDNDAADILVVGKLCGIIWNDCNGDGVQNDFNSGMSGVEVDVFNENHVLMGTVTTNNSGFYELDNLLPGLYYVKVHKPADFFTTGFKKGTVLNVDSDVNDANGECTTPMAYVGGGECDKGDFDAGLHECIPIGELVWYDINKNDIKDAFENGINGIPVELWKLDDGEWSLYATMFTGHKPGTPSDDGYFKFCAPPGTYDIRMDIPEYGLVPTRQNVGSNASLPIGTANESAFDSDVSFGQTTGAFSINCNSGDVCNIGAGYYPMAQIGNRVWIDDNEDGLQSASEQGISGVKVEAFDADDNFINSAVTDGAGEYNINYLGQNDYYLRFGLPNNYILTPAKMGSDEGKDSDVDNSNGLYTTQLISLNSGDSIPTVDAGLLYRLGVVPIEWVSFTGEHKGNYNLLEWQTAREVNSSHFVIERSLNSTTGFTEIGKVAAAGSSSEVLSYDTRDYDIELGGAYYYRLKQVDFNEEFSYSDIVRIDIERVGEYKMDLYPNPARVSVNLDIDIPRAGMVEVSIWDATGKLVANNVISEEMTAGLNTRSIDIRGYASGMYSVKIEVGNTSFKKKLIILKN